MKHLLLGIAALTLSSSAIAQAPHVCGTDHERLRIIAQDPTFLDREAANNAEIARLIEANKSMRGGEEVLTVPIVFHILHQRGSENISYEQIQDQMVVLNRDFRKLNTDQNQVIPEFQPLIGDAKIEFVLATKDPFGNCHNGINRIQSVGTFLGESTSKRSQWPRDRYLNVWVAKQIRSGAAGYVVPPEATEGFGQILDGVMQLASYTGSIGISNPNNSRTLTHEAGHWINLSHPWGNTNEPGVVCGDDGVEDTPITKGWNFCPSPANSAVCDPAIKENYQNYMDYSYCGRMFTVGQVERMRASLAGTTAGRSNLWTESNLILTGVAEGFQATCPPEADFYAVVGTSLNSPIVPFNPLSCTGVNVRFMDNSSRAFPTSWSWTFEDATPATSTDRNPTVQFNSPGWKSVTLTVGNAQGTTSKTIENAVLISNQSEAWQAPIAESFENNEGIWPYLENNHDLNHTFWQRYTGAGTTGNHCVRLNSGDRNPFDLVNPNNVEDYDDLVSPNLTLAGLSSATLSFFYSYSTQTTNLANVTEKLEVYSSIDCGRTWQVRTTISGQNLITNGASTGPGNWVARNISLPQSVLTSNVRFRFRFISSEFSGDLYIDDISIGAPVGIESVNGNTILNLFPNPTNDQFTLQVLGMESSSTNVMVQDLRGAVVYQNVFAPQAGNGIELSARGMDLAEGMYLLRVSNGAGTSTQKLIVGR
jgi:PKD repeat protein